MLFYNHKYMLIFILSFFIFSFVSCGDNNNEEKLKKDLPVTEETDQKIIRTGAINVMNIDENKDGKLFECPMDWNVISDKGGNCPVCQMKLKEFTTTEVKENLVRFGYETVD